MQGKTVQNEADFLELFDEMKARSVEIFNTDKFHSHLVFLLTPDGTLAAVPFDDQMNQIHAALGGGSTGLLKDLTYKLIADVARKMGALGVIEVFECWGIMSHSEGADLEEAQKRTAELIARHGKDLGDVPGRVESLMIVGAYRTGVKRGVRWEIRRLSEDFVVLGEPEITDNYVGGEGRSGEVFKVIMGK